jgi:hypothetical protein
MGDSGMGLNRNGDVGVAPLPSEPPLRDIGVERLDGALSDLEADLGELSFLCAAAENRLAGLESALSDACPYPPTCEPLGRAAASARRRYRAAGTEHRLELDALTDVLATAIETSVSSPRRS